MARAIAALGREGVPIPARWGALRHLCSALPRPEHRVLYVCDTHVTATAIYRNLAHELGLALLVPIWLMFAIVRVTVTPSHLDVKYGPFGPRIPLAQIDSVEPTRYHWSSWGGWGIRRKLGTGEVLYAMPGDQGHGVRVRWTPPDGRQHSAVVGVREPSTIVDAVAAARRVLSPAAAGHALPSGSTPSTPSAPQDPAGDQVDRGDIDVSR